MSTKNKSELELIVWNFVRNEYETKFNKRYIPVAITIIKSEYGNIFGGETTNKLGDSRDGEDIDDKDAFVFLIRSKDEYIQAKCPMILDIRKSSYRG